MTNPVSDENLRELAVLRAGRNVAPQWAAGYGAPVGEVGVDLSDSMLCVVSLVREPVVGVDVNYCVIEGALGTVGTTYALDLDGTAVSYTTASGDTPSAVMDALAELVAEVPGYTPKRLAWPMLDLGDTYQGIRVVGDEPAPTVTSGTNLVVRGAPASDTEYKVWLRQALADGEAVWSVPPDGLFAVEAGNLVERLTTSGFDRVFIELMALPASLGAYQEAYAGPCTVEP